MYVFLPISATSFLNLSAHNNYPFVQSELSVSEPFCHPDFFLNYDIKTLLNFFLLLIIVVNLQVYSFCKALLHVNVQSKFYTHDKEADYLCYLLPLTFLHTSLNLINISPFQNGNMVLAGTLQSHHQLTVMHVFVLPYSHITVIINR